MAHLVETIYPFHSISRQEIVFQIFISYINQTDKYEAKTHSDVPLGGRQFLILNNRKIKVRPCGRPHYQRTTCR